MHELSTAESGVPSALAFGFELVAQGTPIEGAELEMVEDAPSTGLCQGCGAESRLEEFPCTAEQAELTEFSCLRGREEEPHEPLL